jgi:LysR family transcriptional regulator, glycine cleavage system transcriptional activator
MVIRSRPISLLALRAFEAAARHSSFTDAARELHVTQAAISRQVRALETELGKSLFRRLHRRVELTVGGKRLASGLTVGFQHIHQAVENSRTVSKPLRVSVEPAFASRWLMPRLRKFTQAQADIELQLEASDALRSLGAEADIAIRFIAAPRARASSGGRRLFSIECVPVIASSEPDLATPRGDTDVLSRVLLHDDDGRAWRSWFRAAKLSGFDHMKHQYLSDYALALDAAQRGNGVALGATIFLESELAGGGLKTIGRTRVVPGSYWLLEANSRATAKSRLAFTNWLSRELQGDA